MNADERTYQLSHLYDQLIQSPGALNFFLVGMCCAGFQK